MKTTITAVIVTIVSSILLLSACSNPNSPTKQASMAEKPEEAGEGASRQELQALVERHEEQENWAQVVKYSRRILETEDEPEARVALLTRIGDVLANEVGEPDRAVSFYLDALEAQPSNKSVLGKLLAHYSKTNQWPETVEMLRRLIEHETDRRRIAKYSYTIGVIYRDKIVDPIAAVGYFDDALDADVNMLEAFEAIDRILTQAEKWKELERAYRRMLERVHDGDDGEKKELEVLLWTNLGEIYRRHLGHVQSAILAYEAAAGLRPKDAKLRHILDALRKEKASDADGGNE